MQFEKWNEVKKINKIRKVDMLALSKDGDDPEGICTGSVTQNSLNVKNKDNNNVN